MTPSLLSTSLAYQSWQRSTQSCLLLLSGHTALEGRNGRGYTHSWLSPTTTHVTEELHEQGKLVAYYCCHPGPRPEKIIRGKDIIAAVVYQILEWHPEVLRRKEQQFGVMVRSEEWRSQNEGETLEISFRLLREVLVELKDLGTFYIVLDRIDLGSWKLHRVMTALMRLVLDEQVGNVKIMTTAAEFWDIESLELNETVRGKVLAHQEWNQRLMTPMEIHQARTASSMG